MTDNDIIKALECCAISRECGKCPAYEPTEQCITTLQKNALDLINRQQAEIERLKYQVNRLKEYDEKRDIALHSRLIATSRAEAVKEFAERLKEKERPTFPLAMVIDVYEIDNLVKEMVGETK